jgi:hypothetical protein
VRRQLFTRLNQF